MHVLPAGFHRIRYHGFLNSQFRARNIARIRELLAAPLLYSTNLWLLEDTERQARLNRRIRTAAQRILLHYRFEIGAYVERGVYDWDSTIHGESC